MKKVSNISQGSVLTHLMCSRSFNDSCKFIIQSHTEGNQQNQRKWLIINLQIFHLMLKH